MRSLLRPRRTRLALVVAGVALLGSGLSACSDVPPPVVDASSITAQLRRVPNTANTRRSIYVTIYGRADDAAGTTFVKRQSSKKQELDRARKLLADAAAFPGVLGPNQNIEQQYRSLGYSPSDISAEVVAGLLPDTYDLAIGRFADKDGVSTEKEVLDHATQVKGSERKKVHGKAVVRWLDDLAIDPKLDVPIGPMRGQAGRLGFPHDGVLAYTHTDRSIEQFMEVETGDAPSLASDKDLAHVATYLDKEKAYSAYLSDRAFSRGILERYRAIGVGVAGTVAKPKLVIVLANADVKTAEANLATLRTTVASDQRYAKALTRGRLARHGTTVVARFDASASSIWYQLLRRLDPLLGAQ